MKPVFLQDQMEDSYVYTHPRLLPIPKCPFKQQELVSTAMPWYDSYIGTCMNH